LIKGSKDSDSSLVSNENFSEIYLDWECVMYEEIDLIEVKKSSDNEQMVCSSSQTLIHMD